MNHLRVAEVGSYSMRVGSVVLSSTSPPPSSEVTSPPPSMRSLAYFNPTDLSTRDCCYIGHSPSSISSSVGVPFVCEGDVTDWDLFEEFLHYALHGDPSIQATTDHEDVCSLPLLLTHPQSASRHVKENITEIVMEKLNCKAFFTAGPAELVAKAVGITTGVVLDLGHSHSTATPFVDGYELVRETRSINYGGSTKELFTFQHANMDPNWPRLNIGCQSLIPLSIQKCYMDDRQTMFEHVVLCGGMLHVEGLRDEVAGHIQKACGDVVTTFDSTIEDKHWDPQSVSWRGMEKVARSPHLLDHCVRIEDYDEVGPNLVVQKCYSVKFA